MLNLNENDIITITLTDGQKLEMKSGFIGGFLKEPEQAHFGMYTGTLSLEKTSVALQQLFRAVIKMNTEDQFMNQAQSEAFIKFNLEQAFITEEKNKKEDNLTVDEHNEILIKMKNDKSK